MHDYNWIFLVLARKPPFKLEEEKHCLQRVSPSSLSLSLSSFSLLFSKVVSWGDAKGEEEAIIKKRQLKVFWESSNKTFTNFITFLAPFSQKKSKKKMMKNSAILAEENMSNLTSASGEASVSSSNRNDNNGGNGIYSMNQPPPAKKKRSQPGHPDPDAEVIALSPRSLLATNRFVCEICNKGFQRDQNLQLHRRGHNLPWKLKQRTSKEIRKKVYVCPETSCVHHDPSRALGDLTGIKKHFCRKHGEKKWKCEKCSKKYAVQSDWKAHSKTCGTREYRCDCGTLFSRRDSFITHRAFCDVLAEESARSILDNNNNNNGNNTVPLQTNSHHINLQQIQSQFSNANDFPFPIKKEQHSFTLRPEIPPWLACPGPGPGPAQAPIDLTSPSSLYQDFQIPNPNPSAGPTPYDLPPPPPHISATALLQKAAQMGAKSSCSSTPSPAGGFSRPHVSAGPNLSSRDEFISGLAAFGNKAAAAAAATVTGGGSTGGTTNPSPSLFHDMMMMGASGYEGSTFDDMSFAGILNHSSKKVQETLDFHATMEHFSSPSGNENGGNNDSMTRDFLGLRPLSQSDILSIAGLSNCINGGDQNQTQKSWQG